jgi:hypothetical protein
MSISIYKTLGIFALTLLSVPAFAQDSQWQVRPEQGASLPAPRQREYVLDYNSADEAFAACNGGIDQVGSRYRCHDTGDRFEAQRPGPSSLRDCDDSLGLSRDGRRLRMCDRGIEIGRTPSRPAYVRCPHGVKCGGDTYSIGVTVSIEELARRAINASE